MTGKKGWVSMAFTKDGYEAYIEANGGKNPFDEMFSSVKELWEARAYDVLCAEGSNEREAAFCKFYPVDKTAKMLVNSASSHLRDNNFVYSDILDKINDFRRWYLSALLDTGFVSSTSISNAVIDDELSVEYSLSLGDLEMSQYIINIDEIDYDFDDEAEVVGQVPFEEEGIWTGKSLSQEEAFEIVNEQYDNLEYIEPYLSSFETICYKLDAVSSSQEKEREQMLNAIRSIRNTGFQNEGENAYDLCS